MKLVLINNNKYYASAVILCIGWMANLVYGATPLSLPIVQQPFQHEAYQFGYAPNYVVNVPSFDSFNRPYIRSRAGDPMATATSGYIHTFRNGQWVQLDFMPAIMEMYPGFELFSAYNGYEGCRVVFDADDGMYTLVIVKTLNGLYFPVLIFSADYGKTFKVYELPGGRYDIEQWVGHNSLNRPPLLYRFSEPSENDANVVIDLIQPGKVGDTLTGTTTMVNVTNKGLFLTRHAGHSSFAVSTTGGIVDKTYITWVETANGLAPGSPTYVAEYDPVSKNVSNKVIVAYSEVANDVHNTPAIAVDSQGYLHVITGSEQDHFLYARSLQPYSVTGGFTTPVYTYDKGWKEDSGSVEEGKMAYVSMLIDPDDNVHLVFRNWRKGVDSYLSSGVIAALAYQTKTTQGNWPVNARLMVIPPFTGYSNYYQKLAMDKRGNLFLFYEYLESEADVYSYPENPVTNYYPALITSSDSGQTWHLAGDDDFVGIEGYLKNDLNKDFHVDFADFSMLAKNWLKCNDPTNSNCW